MAANYVPNPHHGIYPETPTLVLPNPTMSPAMAAPVGPTSCHMTCPSCQARISTRTENSSTTKTHVIALLLCLCLCWPCVCVPYCMDSCKVTNHYCPNCKAFLGVYNR